MKNLLIFGSVAIVVALVIATISGEDRVDIDDAPVRLVGSDEGGLAAITKADMTSCLSSPYDGEAMVSVLALIQADLNSSQAASERERIEAKMKSFVMEMGVKLKTEFDRWDGSADCSKARQWRKDISKFLQHTTERETFVALQKKCDDILWVVDVTRSSEAMKKRKTLLASEYSEDEIADFLERVSRIQGRHKAKTCLREFSDESELLFSEFKSFHVKWSRAIGLYTTNGGKDPANWIRTPSRYLREAEIRRYSWYASYWVDLFGEIDPEVR